MKQKSIDLLKAFLDSQMKVGGLSYEISIKDEYAGFWHFGVTVKDNIEKTEMEMDFSVDFRDESVWIDMGIDMGTEKVEEDRWNCKYFWYRMYCLK